MTASRYSGSAETQLQEDINKIKEASSFEEAIKSLHKEVRPLEITPEVVKESLHYRGIGRFFKLLLYLVIFIYCKYLKLHSAMVSSLCRRI